MSLLKDVSVGPDRPLFILSNGSALSRNSLRDACRSVGVRLWREGLRSARIGICCKDNSLLAILLLLLDGVVAQISLMPADLSPELIGNLATETRTEVIISDRSDANEFGVLLASLPPSVTGVMFSSCSGMELAEDVQTDWILPTSGTTRTPKLVVHSVETLSQTVKRDFEKGSGLRWGLLYNLNRFAGIQVYLQSILGGASLIIPNESSTLEESFALFAKAGCNALSATPTLWRKILMTPGGTALNLRQITLGGEISDQSLLSALALAFPAARIVHIYASTEAGVGFSVTDGREGFPSNFLHGGLKTAELRLSPEGILEIKPSATGQRYLGENAPLAGPDGFVSTGDRVQIEAERVYFLGRHSGAINVGGNKVQPEKVERILLEHPSVALASVVAKRSGITGSLVEARVILVSETSDPLGLVASIRQWCSSRLERYEVPALIRIVSELDINASGKISRS
jgi:acyl-CoA synthetase (AMP-forming)/AMP-acid ligase II